MVVYPRPTGMADLLLNLYIVSKATNNPLTGWKVTQLQVFNIRGYPILPEKEVAQLIYNILHRHGADS